jgi:hypothetical protein|tara:strand:- start:56688 stop:56846 length:159 start_codon:yes stop_codon:yes gene_type:complete
MFKTFLILILIYAGYRFIKNVRLVQKTPDKKEKTNYRNMDIQDAEYNEIDDE